MITPEALNKMIDDAINALANDNPKVAGEAMAEVCHIYARAGLPASDFAHTRDMIIQEAELKTDALFIREKLQVVEQELQRERVLCH